MYDSVRFWKYTDEKIVKYLSKVRTIHFNDSGDFIHNGYLENLFVSQRDNGISVSNSLPKFYFNNNHSILNKNSTKKAIEKLSDCLHLDMRNAFLNRIDFGNTLILNNSLVDYFQFLGEIGYLKRSEFGNKEALLYSNKSRALSFYNKIEDLKRHREFIPKEFQNKNLLRYEIKLFNKIASQMKMDEILSSMLYESNLFVELSYKWSEDYFSINKHTELKTGGISQMSTLKQLEKRLASIGLKFIGENNLLKLLNSPDTNIGKMNKSRIKKGISELNNIPDQRNKSYLIEELDNAIIEKSNEFLDDWETN